MFLCTNFGYILLQHTVRRTVLSNLDANTLLHTTAHFEKIASFEACTVYVQFHIVAQYTVLSMYNIPSYLRDTIFVHFKIFSKSYLLL